MKFPLRFRDDTPWEVVDQAEVEPIFMYDEEEDLTIARVCDEDMCTTYVFDVKAQKHLQKTLWYSRQTLLEGAANQGFNVLLYEGWRLTLTRKGKKHRVQVQYRGRPAYAVGKLPPIHPPPFLALLESCKFT
ncbi:hypothetical protein GLOTRDRAFT_109214 [Gloeophyllum trabeum ATCC 11539]|uniref:Uncharacterized protein n=1 Tax=Gloeophyllum trabeum (strain ATCC 11539 / FP-39264 / Madison 617) TaxID=670483 RepID=S7S4S6_GLOTA|nr:uncharacterized protein GLOTRDRAFT_109214 [Gloeophyllum trabeum ATCC 11539]EPQ60929.1 hypothetical protein GLOTRDRAFT_109214 [Gloeophyllum trabeum ATCC 11539]